MDQTFDVRGVGSVLSGTVLSGQISLGQQLWLGPADSGSFSAVSVTGIQREQVHPHHLCTGPPSLPGVAPQPLSSAACFVVLTGCSIFIFASVLAASCQNGALRSACHAGGAAGQLSSQLRAILGSQELLLRCSASHSRGRQQCRSFIAERVAHSPGLSGCRPA